LYVVGDISLAVLPMV